MHITFGVAIVALNIAPLQALENNAGLSADGVAKHVKFTEAIDFLPVAAQIGREEVMVQQA